MPGNEALKPSPKIFPIGDTSSKRAIADLFPKGTGASEIAATNLTQELTIMRNHYEYTLRFMTGTVVRLQNRGKFVDPGMILMHKAARIEAQTKRTLLPAINADQLSEYRKLMGRARDPFIAPRIDDDYILFKFKAEERSMEARLRENYELRMNRSDLEMGCALMWDFLKVAPTLPSEKK